MNEWIQKKKWNEELSEKSFFLPEAQEEWIFVSQWLDGKSGVFGLGCNEQCVVKRLTLETEPGLFVVSANLDLLSNFLQLKKLQAKVYKRTLFSNTFTCLDVMLEPAIVQKCLLVKILTKTFEKSRILHRELKAHETAHKFAAVSHYWSVTQFVLLQIFANSGAVTSTTSFAWFNKKLETNETMLEPDLPAISLRIETKSTDLASSTILEKCLLKVSINYIHSGKTHSLAYNTTQNNYNERVEMCTSEIMLLERTLDLLTLDGRLHLLYGFNSHEKDIKLLFNRCVFYKLIENVSNFVWKNGFCYGLNQLHIDVSKLSLFLFPNTKSSLSGILEYLFNETETFLTKENRTFQECLQISKIVKFTNLKEIIFQGSNSCAVTFGEFCELHTLQQLITLNNAFLTALQSGRFFAKLQTNKMEESLHLSGQKKTGYPGGISFCLSEEVFDNLQVYDYNSAYPSIISSLNLSDETAEIKPASFFLRIFPQVINKENYDCYDYLTHNGITSSETKILHSQFITENRFCGEKFEFTHKNLKVRGSNLIAVLLKKRNYQGTCSIIAQRFCDDKLNLQNLLKEQKKDKWNGERELDSKIKLKKLVASTFTGILGKINPSLGALITCSMRVLLLETAQLFTKKFESSVVYCNTDSIFVEKKQNGEDLLNEAHRFFPNALLKFESEQWHAMIQKQMYYTQKNGNLIYFFNKNSPRCWQDAIQFFFKNSYHISNLEEMQQFIHIFYKWVYSNEITFFEILSPDNCQKMYCSINHSDFTEHLSRPMKELSLKNLREINAYTMFKPVEKLFFNIIKWRLKENSRPWNVTLSYSTFSAYMFGQFVSFYDKKFPTKNNDDLVISLLSFNVQNQ